MRGSNFKGNQNRSLSTKFLYFLKNKLAPFLHSRQCRETRAIARAHAGTHAN